jgi:NADH-ubiquinone oxidoreductase chain 5
LFQTDIKKVIAFSTCSQLGYMFLACGLSNYQGALFHLFNHAFFKALLFLGAGVIIHALFNEQDMRKMGLLIKFLPITYICMLIGSFAIMGLPFLTGFYSKDFILEFTFSRFLINAEFIYLIGCLSAFFTAVYSSNILMRVFLYKYNNDIIIFKCNEGTVKMLIIIGILAVFSIFIGFVMNDLMIGFGSYFSNLNFFIENKNYYIIDIEFLNFFQRNLPILLSLLGFLLAIIIFNIDFFNILKK